jgi:hypothetical protein
MVHLPIEDAWNLESLIKSIAEIETENKDERF